MKIYKSNYSIHLNRIYTAIMIAISAFIIAIIFTGLPLFAQAPAKKNTATQKKPSVNSSKDRIPEEFRRVGKGLPPSKQKKLQQWLWKLHFDDTFPRMRAAREIYWYKDMEAIPHLVLSLRDPYWGVRLSAVRALNYIGLKKYKYVTYLPPDFFKIRNMEEELVRNNLSLAEKGVILLNAEKIRVVTQQIDIIDELKAAYYREVQFFKEPYVKGAIRKALENMGSIKKIKGLKADTYNENRKLNQAK